MYHQSAVILSEAHEEKKQGYMYLTFFTWAPDIIKHDKMSIVSSFLVKGILSDEFYDVTPDIGSLIPSYPSMNDSRGVVKENDYMSDSDESFQSAEESLNYEVNNLSFILQYIH